MEANNNEGLEKNMQDKWFVPAVEEYNNEEENTTVTKPPNKNKKTNIKEREGIKTTD